MSGRACRTESGFVSDGNERVRDLSSGFADLSHVSDWVCECANVSCTERINLTAEEYERVRAESADFLISPSQEHVVPEVEVC